MCAVKRAARFPALLAALLTGGCAANPAPRGWLPRAEALPRSTRGAWIVVATRSDDVSKGELIAVSDRGLDVLTASGLHTVALGDIARATAALYEPETMGAGPILILSHGWYMPFTLSMWTAAATGASYAPLVVARNPVELSALRKYARFPQGLPPTVDASALGPLVEHEP